VLVQSTLAEQVELLRSELHGCLAWVESFLVRAEASLGRLSAMPVVAPLVGLLDGSLGRVEADLFGSFSPRRKPCTPVFPAMSRVSKSEATVEVVASVLQIMSNLVEMCVEPHSPVPMVHLKVDSPVATAVPLTPTRPPLEGAQLLALRSVKMWTLFFPTFLNSPGKRFLWVMRLFCLVRWCRFRGLSSQESFTTSLLAWRLMILDLAT
jgi:hypothetical protein